ncbi:MAG TPA: hypothetical protein VK306_08570 [Acidimicrobiales bacterium]|nr:hypothetical protein [Acidimicrobiales bacterium]
MASLQREADAGDAGPAPPGVQDERLPQRAPGGQPGPTQLVERAEHLVVVRHSGDVDRGAGRTRHGNARTA